ncbi:LCP family protein [Aeromicrobium sp. CTD01-1L150]|uniref:LCP family protein n=1 Tax=Aeromicrobium sp. CTD01-1L150 TaxID=3341830 RepID=UPI0035BF2DFC
MTRRRAKLLSRGQDADVLSPRLRFRRAIALVILSAAAPGSAQVAVGRRLVGWIGLLLWGAVIGVLVATAWRFRDDRAGLIGMATDSTVLMVARIGLVAFVVIWLAYLADAFRLAKPFALPAWRAGVVVILNVALLLGVAGTAAYASQLAGVQRSVVNEVFAEKEVKQPLEGRYNILLIGSDSGDDRDGIRPDSLTVVSVDADDGDAVLISLPRNLQNVPFREDSPMREIYPYGYNCGGECLINAVHTEGRQHPELYPDADDPGLEATIDAVEGSTDLTISYYVMVNLRGFESLVDAVGGVEIDVPTRLAKFGLEDAWKQEYLEAGKQKLNGEDALWYARSRVQSDDFTRMGRQKCLMAAMLDQMSPQKVLLNATDIARSSEQLLSTDIPAAELGPFGDLALKSRDHSITSVSLVPPEVNVAAPDWDEVHRMIRVAIGEEDEPEETTPTPAATTEAPSPSIPDQQDDLQEENRRQAEANNADDLSETC